MGSGCFRELIVPSSSSQENHKLRDQNDDLNGQILSLSLYEAKNLFATQTKAQSLASEIDTASRDEVACPFTPALTSGPGPPLALPHPHLLQRRAPGCPEQGKQTRPGPREAPSATTLSEGRAA